MILNEQLDLNACAKIRLTSTYPTNIIDLNAPPETSSTQPERFCRPDGLVANWKSLPNTETAECDAPAQIPGSMLLSNESELASKECFSKALWCATFHASQSSQSKKRFGVEPLLRTLTPEMGHQELDLSR